MAEGDRGTARYAAFLSYSHKDEAVARWLHRKLESYRIPKRLAGTEGERGTVPSRLTPIFRDRDELPAAGDLSEKVRAALAASDSLIVICSPNSAGSPWVAKEIAEFRELHPGKPIFAAIVEGEPVECFPEGLVQGQVEPLAADLRPNHDGQRLGLLKLVAGLSSVGLDDLIQRDAQRRIRQVSVVTAVALAAMLIMALLTLVALDARVEAQNQRLDAEGLVEFMLTDLRRELKDVGSVKVRVAANRRALEYYRHQNLDGLPIESLERRARVLHNLGEDYIDLNRPDEALTSFREAATTTGQLLKAAPTDPDRVFAHSQSEFWIGRVAHQKKRYAEALKAFKRYKALVAQLVEGDPANRKWREELAYADGSLCTVALDGRMNLDFALGVCSTALENMNRAGGEAPDGAMRAAIANRKAWLADAYRARGNRASAWKLRVEQEVMLAELRRNDPDNLDLMESWLTNQFSMGELEIDAGALTAARARLRKALIQVEKLTSTDPANAAWASRRRRILDDLAKLD